MQSAVKIFKYEVYDILRAKWLAAFAFSWLLVSTGFLYFTSDPRQAVVSLLNLVLIFVSLLSMLMGSIHFYHSREFMELILSQPVGRKYVFLGKYAALSLAISLSLCLGIILPFLIFSGKGWDDMLFLLASGIFLTFVCVALGFLVSTLNEEKIKGLGILFILWFGLSVAYDGITFLLIYLFSDYPVEKFVLTLTFFNPFDLVRILSLLHLDISALMGYTGAVFKEFFGSRLGILLSSMFLLAWVILPLSLGLYFFRKKDF